MNPLMSKATALLMAAGSLVTAACSRTPGSGRAIPVTEESPWKEFVPVKGQALPVPVQWLQSEEARIAHNLVLPKEAQLFVPFDFKAAERKAWFGPSVGRQYYQHLCDYEAGEWIFEQTEPQEAYYDARPIKVFDESQRRSMYFFENPHIQLYFRDGPEVPQRKAGFTEPYRSGASSNPLHHFRFYEQPTPRDEEWAKDIKSKYIRHFQERTFDKFGHWSTDSPWRLDQLEKPSVLYGTTWRGLLRPRDREFRIAGSEQIVYEIATGKVLGLRRTFRWINPPGTTWPGAWQCSRIQVSGTDKEHLGHLAERVIGSFASNKLGYWPTPLPTQPHPKKFTGSNSQ